MKSAKAYFNSLLSTDSNCPIDVYNHKYDREDLFRFAEAYHKDRVSQVTDEDIIFAIDEWVNEEPARGYCRYGFDSGAKWLKSKLKED